MSESEVISNKKSKKHRKSKRDIASDKKSSKKKKSQDSDTPKVADKNINRLKRNIMDWLDHDDKIKELNSQIKEYKDAKKEKENTILDMIGRLGLDNTPLNVCDKNNNLRGKVSRCRSTTRGALKEDIIRNALMEAIRNEGKVEQLIKKIDSKRPVVERYYLKRTKGDTDS